MSPAAITIHRLHLSFPGKHGATDTEIIRDLSLDVAPGNICSVVGPSGCGKSTLLYILAGILTRYTGSVLINGTPPNPKHQSIGLVPQHYGLLPWKRIQENILLPQTIKNTPSDPAYTEEILSALHLHPLLHRYPHQLSGGQQQRAALARSFIQKPDILLMDEPFAALDLLTAEQSRRLFLDLWRRHQVTTLFVTHNIDEAVNIGTETAVLSPLPGQLTAKLAAPSASEVRQLLNHARQ